MAGAPGDEEGEGVVGATMAEVENTMVGRGVGVRARSPPPPGG